MTLLQIIGDACDEMGLDRPQGIIGNQQPQVRQLFALLRRLCTDLGKQFDWQQLVSNGLIQTEAFKRTATITPGSYVLVVNDPNGITTDFAVKGEGLVKNSVVTDVSGNHISINRPATKPFVGEVEFGRYRYDLPADYSRMLANTTWDTGNEYRMYGAVSPQGWQALRSSVVNLGIYLKYRIRQGKLEITPTPDNSRAISYEYISKNFVVADGDRIDNFIGDLNETVYDHSLLVVGLMYLWRQSNGLDASTELGEFQSLLAVLKGQDSPSPAIHVSGSATPHLLDYANVLDGNWNV